MRIKSIKSAGKRSVFDLSVKDAEHYILANGVITHNTGSYYAADNIFILGRQQDKDGTELVGYNFIINVEKSRYVREKSKIPIRVSFENGIHIYSGLLDVALESGHVVKPANGWYQKKGNENKVREADTDTREFWLPILNDKTFQEFVEKKYMIAYGDLVPTGEAADD